MAVIGTIGRAMHRTNTDASNAITHSALYTLTKKAASDVQLLRITLPRVLP